MKAAQIKPEDTVKVDIEIYEQHGGNHWAQARYLVHGIDDVLWTDDLEEAITYLKYDLERLLKRKSVKNQKPPRPANQ